MPITRFKKITLLTGLCTALLFFGEMAQALVFTIVPKAGTSLPTQVVEGQTVTALYTIVSNAVAEHQGSFIKYLPPNVTQVTSDGSIPDLCGVTFALRRAESCTLKLTISGAVNGNDPNQRHHLFACLSDGVSCAGTLYPLNVSVTTSPVVGDVFVAVGSYINSSSDNQPLTFRSTNNGVSWGNAVTPALTPGDRGDLRASTCVGQNCLTVGNTNVLLAFVSTDQGQTWSTPIVPSVSAIPGASSGELKGVSCVGQDCATVGYYRDGGGTRQPLLIMSPDSGKMWLDAIPLSLSSFPGNEGGEMLGVSCVGSDCVEAGYYLDSSFVEYPLTFVGSTDPVEPSLSTISGNNGGRLNGISCVSSRCVAVGIYYDGSAQPQPLAFVSTDFGASWSSAITPGLPPSSSDGAIRAVSCVGTHCVAVGIRTDTTIPQEHPMALVSNDGGDTWTPVAISMGGVLNTAARLYSVSCSSATTCVATGSYWDGTSTNQPLSFYTNDGGSTWSAPVLPSLATLPGNEGGELYGVTGSSSLSASKKHSVGYKRK